MIERCALGFTQIVQDGSGSADGEELAGESASIEREELEVIEQRAFGVIESEDPGFRVRLQALDGEPRWARDQ